MKTTRINFTTIKLTLLAILTSLFLTAAAQAATFTVNQIGDAGDGTCDATCTLRDAVTATNINVNSDTIVFDAAVFGTPQTIVLGSTLTITNQRTLIINGPGANLVTISGNFAVRVFIIQLLANVQINAVTISEGNVGGAGAGINNSGTLTLNNASVSNNGSATTGSSGTGIYNVDNASLTVNNSIVTNNRTQGGSGVGIASVGGTLTVNNSTISNNDGNADNDPFGASGGGISATGDTIFTITNSTVSGNISGNGNGIFISNTTTATITDTVINNNTSAPSSNGGGIFIAACNTTNGVTIERTTISNNRALSGGGGIAKGTGADTCPLVINNSTISGNTAVGGGGGIANIGSLTLTNSTVSGNNVTDTVAIGGGILNSNNGTATLNNVTVTNNSAANPMNNGGFANASASSVATLNNTIIANSSNNLDCLNNGTVNASYSLIEAGLTCVNGTNSNNLTGDPNLGPLANNGGTTQTHALLGNSIAIDKGNSTLTTDQRGLTRPVDLATYQNATGGNGSDIGAVELQIAPTAAGTIAGGRVTDANNRGIFRALVTMTDSQGNQRTAYTNQLGFYQFADVAGGQVYVFTAAHRRYSFDQPSQVQFIGEETDGINFTGTPFGIFRFDPWNLPIKKIE